MPQVGELFHVRGTEIRVRDGLGRMAVLGGHTRGVEAGVFENPHGDIVAVPAPEKRTISPASTSSESVNGTVIAAVITVSSLQPFNSASTLGASCAASAASLRCASGPVSPRFTATM